MPSDLIESWPQRLALQTRGFSPTCPARVTLVATVFALVLAAGLLAPQPAQAEDVLTPAVWDGGNGNWSDFTHWTTNPLFPNNGGGFLYDATVNSGSVSVGGNYTVTGLTLTGGTVSIDEDATATATNFTLTGGTVTGNGTLDATGALSFTGGTFGDGTATGTTSGPLAIDFTSSGAGVIAPIYTLENSGAGSWAGTGVLYNAGTLANSGTFTIQNDQSISSHYGGGTFHNTATGMLIKAGATDTTSITSYFNNEGGTVDVQSGTVSLTGGGTATGGATFGGTGGGVISFDGGTFTMADSTHFAGTGVSRVAGGTVSIDGTATATNFTVTGGTVRGIGTLEASGVLSFTGGTFGDGSNAGRTSGPLTIDLTGGSGNINTYYTLENSGAGSWTGTGTLYNYGTLVNSGTLTIRADGQSMPDVGGLFRNESTGTLIGTNGATGTTTIHSRFDNAGTVDVQSGTLSLAGTVDNFNGGTNTLSGGTWRASGAGSTLSIGTGPINTLSGGADVTVGNVGAAVTSLAVTTIGSGSALRSTGGAVITLGGSLTNSGTVEVGGGSTLNVGTVGSPALFTQDGGHLLLTGGTVNASALAITGGEIVGSGLLNGDVTVSGTACLSPGQSIGLIVIDGGDFIQTSGTALLEVGRIFGLPVPAADLLAADGSVSLSNVTITLALVGGSAPLEKDDSFTLFQSDYDNAGGELLTLTGVSFITDASLAPYELTPFSTATTYGYRVTALVPEPGSGIMVALGLLGLLGARRRKRQPD
jgi:hypothetical protein